MKKNILTIIILSFATICSAQITLIKYYRDWKMDKEVPESKAILSVSITKNADGSERTVKKDLIRNKILLDETYKEGEPMEIGKSENYRYHDYHFELVYSDKPCTDSIPGLKDYFSNVNNVFFLRKVPLSDRLKSK